MCKEGVTNERLDKRDFGHNFFAFGGGIRVRDFPELVYRVCSIAEYEYCRAVTWHIGYSFVWKGISRVYS